MVVAMVVSRGSPKATIELELGVLPPLWQYSCDNNLVVDGTTYVEDIEDVGVAESSVVS